MLLVKKMDLFPIDSKDDVMLLQERVSEAQRIVTLEMKEQQHKKGSKRIKSEGNNDDSRDREDRDIIQSKLGKKAKKIRR
jgi:ATP-dependent RNA helicase DDX47/RRP3